MRAFAFVLATAFLAAGCTTVPPGLCETDTECLAGLRCQEGVCAGCREDAHCVAWQQCATATHRCELRADRCETAAQCASFELCNGDHRCEVAPNRCDTAAQCASYETCDSGHNCQVLPGRCANATQCTGVGFWPATCDTGSNTCLSGPAGGNDVMLMGTLQEGQAFREAVSPIYAPDEVRVGFSSTAKFRSAALRPDGSLIYLESAGTSSAQIRIFSRDSFTRGTFAWEYPSNPSVNDAVLGTATCPVQLQQLTVQAGTGSVVYGCENGAAVRSYLDLAGNVLFQGPSLSLLAWNASGLFLALAQGNGLVVITPQDVRTTVALTTSATVLDARAKGAGFAVAIRRNTGTEDVDELYTVDAAGAATLQGTYAAVSGNTVNAWRLDQNGALYGLTNSVAGDIGIKRTPNGAAQTTVYTEANKPTDANSFTATTLRLYNLVHISYLFRGP